MSLGDKIEFSISGRNFTLQIANLRKAIRDGLSPFFYFSFEKDSFASAPKTYFLAASVPDIEAFKKKVLTITGPHVTFIDVGSILELAKSIASKILSVVSLFFLVMSVFIVLAVVALFGRMQYIEKLKRRLYHLFGMQHVSIRHTFLATR